MERRSSEASNTRLSGCVFPGVDYRSGETGGRPSRGGASCRDTDCQHPPHQRQVVLSHTRTRSPNLRPPLPLPPPSVTLCARLVRRLYNYEPLTALRMLRASAFGRLVCVKGTVVRVSNIKPLCTRMAFRCVGGSHVQSLPLQHGKYAAPTKV